MVTFKLPTLRFVRSPGGTIRNQCPDPLVRTRGINANVCNRLPDEVAAEVPLRPAGESGASSDKPE